MEFKEQFRAKYRVALLAARANDRDGTIAGLSDLYNLFAEQYGKDNGDAIVIKAKLSHWQDVFATYIKIIDRYGLKDKRVQKLFGLIDDASAPSLSDVLSGKEAPAAEPSVPEKRAGLGNDINIDGITPPLVDNPENAEDVPPVAEAIPPLAAVPVTPAAPSAPEPVQPDETDYNEEGGGIDAPIYTPDSLRGFIGQQHIIKRLLKEIAIAKNRGIRHLDNILLFGNPGLGKSTLLKLIAKELGVKFEMLDCSQFRNSQQSLKALQNLLMRVARENEPVVIALDEIHMLNTELQSSLLTLLEDRIYVSPPDINGQVKRIPIEEFTFIAATTDDDKVLGTIKNRCISLTFQMVDYTPNELKRIYRNKVSALGLTITDEAIDACIPRSRGAIRYVNAYVNDLDHDALHTNDGIRISSHIDLDTVLRYFEEKGIDNIGLGKKDREILNAIAEDPSGVISADVLSARVGLETKKYLSEHERYLIKIGFISVTGRGRRLTEKAINHIKGAK